ncbi:hypothetical protein [Streptomyces resistomycificus]|uniref:Secreted protein n=1 Tax=Streptomyces resistomycificus TaxID=67356 RepID=A0A0L8LD94_9ACTN|nr:hypothetical protein [Streptomyces resistomycificus]KOG36112.1 hypothetical protein ADK37_14430 [Streptomyces resistomycificus]KUN92308.1 hypothetical protein AQJ84_32995 [Streptomyces resistomycificus]
MRRRLALGLTVLTASGLLAVAAPGSAQAASDTSCAGRKIRTFPFSTGSVKVYKQGVRLCVMTVPKNPGRQRYMMVSIQVRGHHAVVDEGQFSRHAGPRTVRVGQRKVWLKGAVGHGSYDSGGWMRL